MTEKKTAPKELKKTLVLKIEMDSNGNVASRVDWPDPNPGVDREALVKHLAMLLAMLTQDKASHLVVGAVEVRAKEKGEHTLYQHFIEWLEKCKLSNRLNKPVVSARDVFKVFRDGRVD